MNKKKSEDIKKPLRTNMTDYYRDQIKEIAELNKMTVSAVIGKIIIEYLENN